MTTKIKSGLEAAPDAPVALALTPIDVIAKAHAALDDIPNAISEIAALRDSELEKINRKARHLPPGAFDDERQDVIKKASDSIDECRAKIAEASAALELHSPMYSRDQVAARSFSRLDPTAQSAILSRIDRASGAGLVIEAREAAARGDLATGHAIESRLRSGDSKLASREEKVEIANLLALIASPADEFEKLRRADAIRRQAAVVNAGAATAMDASQVKGVSRIKLGLLERQDELTAAPKPASSIEEFLKTGESV